LESEGQNRLRRQLDLLSFGCGLHASAESASSGGSYSGALTAAGEAANDGSNCRTRAYFFRGILAA
jgi:hypothetical protein